MVISLRPGMEKSRDELVKKLVELQYERNDVSFTRNKFRVRGDVVEIFPAASNDSIIRVEFSEMKLTGFPKSIRLRANSKRF